jgi:hypothetical protein
VGMGGHVILDVTFQRESTGSSHEMSVSVEKRRGNGYVLLKDARYSTQSADNGVRYLSLEVSAARIKYHRFGINANSNNERRFRGMEEKLCFLKCRMIPLEAVSFQKNHPIELVLVTSNSRSWSKENPTVNDFVKASRFKNRGTICFIGGGVQGDLEDNKKEIETPNGHCGLPKSVTGPYSLKRKSPFSD